MTSAPPAHGTRVPSEITPAREVAFGVLRRTFEKGAFTDRVFRAEAERRKLTGRDRAQAQRLSYGSVQRRGTSDALIKRLSDREADELDAPVGAALRLGFYELLFADATPDHAAVDQAVELAKRDGAGRGSGFVNALMRRCARERDALLAGLTDADPDAAAVAHSVPRWLAGLWWRELGHESARSLLRDVNEPAETAMRVNMTRADPAVICEVLREAGVDVSRAAPESPVLVFGGPVGEAEDLVAAGDLTPQSRGSALVCEMLDPMPGERILDLCGGPGIKATQIAERIGDEGEVVSVEIDPARRREIDEGAERLGLTCVRSIEGDALEIDLPEGFDRVLVDAPCSDLGALASRPDVRWRKSPEQIERLAKLQGRLARRGLEALKPGGTLVYATCTISRRENEDQVSRLLGAQEGRGADLLDLGELAPKLRATSEPRCLQIRPDRDRTTGFFIAALRAKI